MRLLIIGSGGREDAISWKVVGEGHEVWATPGNPGIAMAGGQCVALDIQNYQALMTFVIQNQINFTIVGPEAPLAAGIVNYFNKHGKAIFGPTKEAARIETSKGFGTDLLLKAGVPVPKTLVLPDCNFLGVTEPMPYPFVVKYDELAAGKGVRIVHNLEEARAAREHFKNYPPAPYLVQKKLEGPELSYFVLTDGDDFEFVGSAQDYKPLYRGGPNTGGMGGFAPHYLLTPELQQRIDVAMVRRTIRAMADAGCPFRGVMYFQLMLTEEGPVVIEINCRFGDPEAELLMPLLDCELLPLLEATAQTGVLRTKEVKFRPNGKTVGIVVTSPGYPDSPKLGRKIMGLDQPTVVDTFVYHAGTKVVDGALTNSGGRVYVVVGLGQDYATAKQRAQEAELRIQFNGSYRRNDIGDEAIAWEQEQPVQA